MQFFETVMGKRFFEGQVPKLINALERIADALEKEPVPEPEPISIGTIDLSDLPLTLGQLIGKMPSNQAVYIVLEHTVWRTVYPTSCSQDLSLRKVKSMYVGCNGNLYVILEEE